MNEDFKQEILHNELIDVVRKLNRERMLRLKAYMDMYFRVYHEDKLPEGDTREYVNLSREVYNSSTIIVEGSDGPLICFWDGWNVLITPPKNKEKPNG